LPGVEWIAGDLATPGALCGGADAVIHIAGTINAADRAAFDAGNVAGTASIVAAAQRAGVRRFVHVSSLTAREPDLSDYGASKAAAEQIVAASGLDAAIIRPPGVYGPGDRETLPLFQMVARGFAVVPGPGRGSWIAAGDLAAALLAVAASEWRGSAEIDDGQRGGYSHAELARAIGVALGRQPRLIPLPTGILRLGATVDTRLARVTGRVPKLSHDRARYLAHPDWVAAPGAGLPPGLWQPATPLADGLAATADWYRAAGWLR
jgi:nucleoside-diphosphate-sugar epimerase